MAEYYLSILLVMYSADMFGLMISCMVRSEQLASQVSPYILIAQLLFSGLLFPMEGASEIISAFMFSRWGMEALGSISNLNEFPMKIAYENGYDITFDPIDYFTYTADHLMIVWLVLLIFVIGAILAAIIGLYSVRKDSR